MKAKHFFLAGILSLFTLTGAFAQRTNINTALSQAAEQFSSSIKTGTTVAILGISSPTTDLSDYMLDELTTDVIRLRKLQVVTRANLDIIKKEMDFQLTGEVSDETMQQLGAKTGAQTVISGTFKQLGTAYILNVQAFNVTTAAIQDVYRTTVTSDNTLALLMGRASVKNGQLIVDDYTAGQRVGMGFANMVLGLGSYTHGHWGDGLLMTAVEGFGFALLVHRDPSGFVVISASCLYGFIRPWFYHKTVKVAMDGTYDGLNIAFAPSQNGVVGKMSYKISL